MGQSTDAYLGWGYCWSVSEGEHDQEEYVEIYDDVLENYDRYEKTHPELEIGSHCSCYYAMLYVAIKTHHHCAWRGEPVIGDGLNQAPPTKAEQKALRAFVIDELDLPLPHEQGWFLCSMWG